MPKGTVLAFDFGLKRIGVAVGEPELKTVHPLQSVSNIDEIHSLVKEWRPARLVVGLPVRESGEHPFAKRVEKFARQLEGRFRLPVARVDERFTSVEAETLLGEAGMTRKRRKARLDMLAAQILLSAWLESRTRGRRRPEALED